MMSSRKGSSSRKTRTRYQPYNGSKRSGGSPAHSTSSLTISNSTLSSSVPRNSTLRDVLVDIIRERFPNFKPRHDFDVLSLSGDNYRGSEEDVFAWLDKELASQVAETGNVDMILAGATKILSGPPDITGRKPRSDTPGVFVRPIPNSHYSIRLFPGSASFGHYCMDFVRTSTGEPVNSPFKFEIWAVPKMEVPSLDPGPGRIISLERSWGLSQREILPGQEKFVLQDGQTYVLRRPGQKNVRFTVPLRAALQLPSRLHDEDVVEFPSIV